MGGGTLWVIHVLDQIALIMYLIYEEFQPNFKTWNYWDGGIVSKVDYSIMFSDLKIVMNTMSEFFADTYESRKDFNLI